MATAWAASLPAQPSEFSAHGYALMRVENEYKLVVPDEVADPLWTWLEREFGPEHIFLRAYDSSFTSRTATDHMVDQYYDDDRRQLLNAGNGVRHRSRTVLTDPGDRKNGRQLMQVKINHVDNNALNRGEFKYRIDTVRTDSGAAERHPFLGMVAPMHRAAITATLKGYGIAADSLYPTILLDQIRRRIYVSRKGEPFATLTLDAVTARYEGKEHHSTELELELNEIGYTEGDSASRAEMERLNGMVKQRVMEHWPMLRQDQTPKYKKAYLALGLTAFTSPYSRDAGPNWPVIGGTSLVILLAIIAIIKARSRKRAQGPANA